MEFKPGSELVEAQDHFGSREVGITHPDVPSHVRVRDNGEVEIVAGDNGAAIILSPNGTITLVGDNIRFFTKEGGLRWNKKAFNSRATKYNEPTLTTVDDKSTLGLYRDVDYFLDEDMSLFSGTTLSESLLSVDEEENQETQVREIAEDESNMA